MIDMADTETKKDEITGEEMVFNQKTGEYVPRTMSTDLYRQQKKAQSRQALLAGTAGLAAEGIQFGIGASIFGDPAIKAAGQEKARLAAELKKGPDYLTEAEKQAKREAALAPVQRKAEAVQRRAEAIAASTGDVSVRSLLASGEAGIAQIRQQALETEADIATEDLTRQQLKDQKDERLRQGIAETDAMMLELRNKYIREPLHKFIGEAGKVAGTMMAFAPAKTVDDQIDKLRRKGVSEEDIAVFAKNADKNPVKNNAKMKELLKKARGGDEGVDPDADADALTPEEEKAAAPVRPTTWKDPAPPGTTWHGVEYTLQNDGNIVYFDPVRKNKRGEPLRLMVRPGSDSYTAIMKHQPESGGQAEGQIARPKNLPTVDEFNAAKEAERLKGMTPEQIEAERVANMTPEQIKAEKIKGGSTVYMTQYTPLPDNKFRPKEKNDPDDPDDPFVQWNEADKSWIYLEENGEPADDDPLTLDMMKNSKPGSMEYKYYTLAKEAGLLEEGTSD